MATWGLGLVLAVASAQSASADTLFTRAAASAPSHADAGFDLTRPKPTPTRLSLRDFALPSSGPATHPFFGQPRTEPPPLGEPFGLQTVKAPAGALWTKWDKVRADTERETPVLARCRVSFRRCPFAARHFVAVIKRAEQVEGRARLAIVNARVNAAIAYVSDMDQWHEVDRWSAPLDRRDTGAFDTGKGDCEDYAIAKYVVLRNTGMSARDLRLLVVRDTSIGGYHAALAARQDGQWWILDNRWSRLLSEREAPFFTPLFALNDEGVMRFTREAARTAQATPRARPTPSTRRFEPIWAGLAPEQARPHSVTVKYDADWNDLS
ncbi:MAG: hypothetical protein B7Y70_14850 [Rhizobiales bacterium 35-68-8]|nr:MAG: hypothetical protein B7Y70_14850 [Rhizobiales bacterium 35-68-8]